MTDSARKPRGDEIDIHGITDLGKVRKTNQDHFLICSLHNRLKIHATSLPHPEQLQFRGERLAFMAIVADGVGGQQAGEEASRIALESVAHYASQGLKCFCNNDAEEEQRFLERLHESILECHARVAEEAGSDPDLAGMATTLTLAIGNWPWAYVAQVGDSRAYQLRGEDLIQITRDQTVAQILYDEGVMNTAELKESSWAHVLSSAIGGEEAAPVTYRISMEYDDVLLLCSDGLTKHVSDERIRHHLIHIASAKEACEALLAEALEDGGSDNITIVVGRVRAGDLERERSEAEACHSDLSVEMLPESLEMMTTLEAAELPVAFEEVDTGEAQGLPTPEIVGAGAEPEPADDESPAEPVGEEDR